MKKIFLISLSLIFFLFNFSWAEDEYSSSNLLAMTIESLSYDVEQDTAFVRGVGRVVIETPQGIFMARRAAISDAQRGLLILKRSIEEDRQPRPESVAGDVPPIKILNEKIKSGLYYVEVQASLSELMQDDLYFENFWR